MNGSMAFIFSAALFFISVQAQENMVAPSSKSNICWIEKLPKDIQDKHIACYLENEILPALNDSVWQSKKKVKKKYISSGRYKGLSMDVKVWCDGRSDHFFLMPGPQINFTDLFSLKQASSDLGLFIKDCGFSKNNTFIWAVGEHWRWMETNKQYALSYDLAIITSDFQYKNSKLCAGQRGEEIAFNLSEPPCVAMANNIIAYSQDKQLFLTTHPPESPKLCVEFFAQPIMGLFFCLRGNYLAVKLADSSVDWCAIKRDSHGEFYTQKTRPTLQEIFYCKGICKTLKHYASKEEKNGKSKYVGICNIS